MGEYLKTDGFKTPFIQSRRQEEQHHHLTGTSGYRKAKTGCLCDCFPKATGKGLTVTYIWQNNQPGMGQKGVLQYIIVLRMKLNTKNSKNSLW